MNGFEGWVRHTAAPSARGLFRRYLHRPFISTVGGSVSKCQEGDICMRNVSYTPVRDFRHKSTEHAGRTTADAPLRGEAGPNDSDNYTKLSNMSFPTAAPASICPMLFWL